MSGTRIASVSGLRGVVGDGLDPAIVVEFAAAYASRCAPGPIVVGHDGRVSAPVFVPAVLAGVTATGRDALLVGATATPTIGRLVRDQGAAGGIQISASHNPPGIQRPEVLPARGDGPQRRLGARGPRPARASRVRLGRLGRARAGPHPRRSRRRAPEPGAQDRRRRGDPPAEVRRSCSTPATAPGAGWARRCSGRWVCRR